MKRDLRPIDALGATAPSDCELLRQTAAGCESSFRILFRRWAPRLGRFLTQATGSRETAEDLLQEAFLRVLRGAPRYEARGAAGAWLYRICANLAYSHWRRRRASPIHGTWDPATLAQVAAPARAGPEQARLRAAMLGAARAAVQRLPENQRLVFLLKVDQGLTYERIAEVLGCPVGTAKSRFHHAVGHLREQLREWGHEGGTDELASHEGPDVLQEVEPEDHRRPGR